MSDEPFWVDLGCWGWRPWYSNVTWATGYINKEGNPVARPGQEMGWDHARRYFALGLTHPDQTIREEYLAKTFLALGHVSHLLQDSSVPAHVRNDFTSHYIYYGPYPVIPLFGYGNRLENYIAANDELVAMAQKILLKFNDSHITDFWDRTDQLGGPYLPVGLSPGLSEWVNANYFSDWTIRNNHPTPEHDFALPAVDSETMQICEDLAPKSSRLRKYLSRKNGQPCPLPSPAREADHFAVASLLNLSSSIIPENIPSLYLWLDDNVHNTYAKEIIPLAISYTAALLDYFFRGDLEIIAGEGDYLKIKNASGEEMKGAFTFYYDASDGTQWPVLGGSWELTLAPDAESEPLRMLDPTDMAEPGKFTLVFQGRHGREKMAVAGKVWDRNPPGDLMIFYTKGGEERIAIGDPGLLLGGSAGNLRHFPASRFNLNFGDSRVFTMARRFQNYVGAGTATAWSPIWFVRMPFSFSGDPSEGHSFLEKVSFGDFNDYIYVEKTGRFYHLHRGSHIRDPFNVGDYIYTLHRNGGKAYTFDFDTMSLTLVKSLEIMGECEFIDERGNYYVRKYAETQSPPYDYMPFDRRIREIYPWAGSQPYGDAPTYILHSYDEYYPERLPPYVRWLSPPIQRISSYSNMVFAKKNIWTLADEMVLKPSQAITEAPYPIYPNHPPWIVSPSQRPDVTTRLQSRIPWNQYMISDQADGPFRRGEYYSEEDDTYGPGVYSSNYEITPSPVSGLPDVTRHAFSESFSYQEKRITRLFGEEYSLNIAANWTLESVVYYGGFLDAVRYSHAVNSKWSKTGVSVAYLDIITPPYPVGSKPFSILRWKNEEEAYSVAADLQRPDSIENISYSRVPPFEGREDISSTSRTTPYISTLITPYERMELSGEGWAGQWMHLEGNEILIQGVYASERGPIIYGGGKRIEEGIANSLGIPAMDIRGILYLPNLRGPR